MRAMIAAAAALALASCGGSGGGDNEGAASEKAGGGGAVSFQPGQWEMTTEVTKIDMPNMPQGMSAPMPPPTTVSVCLTPEQAAAPTGDFITGSGQNGGCRSQNMRMADGRIEGTIQCDSQGTQMTSNVDGRFTSTSYEINQRVQTSAQGATMNMESRTTGRRVGDCPA